MLLSRKALRMILGALWLIDGLLQVQPQMWTMNMVNGVMKPMLKGQPGFLLPSLHFIVNQTTMHLIEVNLLIAVVQILLGLGFLLLSDRWVKDLVIASSVWALIVWFAGEGLSMLLTGTSSILSGAPGAVLLYPLLGLAIWPRRQSAAASKEKAVRNRDDGLLSRKVLRWVLSGFWFFAALLQLQPFWWQSGQVSQVISGMIGQGGLDSVLVDPVLTPLAHLTAPIEIPLNIVLIVVFLAVGLGLALPGDKHLRSFLIASIVVSLVVWYFAEALGLILTGMATDFNSGLLLVVIALACWSQRSYAQITQASASQITRTEHQEECSRSAQRAWHSADWVSSKSHHILLPEGGTREAQTMGGRVCASGRFSRYCWWWHAWGVSPWLLPCRSWSQFTGRGWSVRVWLSPPFSWDRPILCNVRSRFRKGNI